jgi:hypothetical protein
MAVALMVEAVQTSETCTSLHGATTQKTAVSVVCNFEAPTAREIPEINFTKIL